jgi:hypothetical protein
MSAGRSAVKHYLRIVKDVYDGATAGDEAVLELGDGNKEDGRQLARLIWAALRNARVFEIDSDLYNAITVEASVHCWEKIGGIKKGVSFNDVSPEEGQAAFDKLWTAAESLPVFSDIMPFDHIFIGISGHGTNIPNDVLRCLIQDPPDRMIRACINGYLIGPVHGGNDVDVVVFVRITGPGGIDYTVPCVERMSVSGQPAEWTNVAFLFPWIVNSMLTFIHDHKTTIIESAPTHGIRRDYDRLAKQMGGTLIIPRPFYTVPMRDKVIINRAARKAVYGVQKRTPLTYRHDRRGHERCLIQRGQMPMAEETRTKLEKRGYKIFTINPVDAETNRLLAERGQRPKRADEWLATLVSWVTPTIVGPVDAPYVPAVRVSERFGGSR